MIIIPMIKTQTDKDQQLLKMKEELQEVIDAYYSNEGCERVLEECFDVIQATITGMTKVASTDEIQTAGAKHFLKMRERGWETDGMWEINIK